jgi:hypothetical protein
MVEVGTVAKNMGLKRLTLWFPVSQTTKVAESCVALETVELSRAMAEGLRHLLMVPRASTYPGEVVPKIV